MTPFNFNSIQSSLLTFSGYEYKYRNNSHISIKMTPFLSLAHKRRPAAKQLQFIHAIIYD